MTKNIITTNIIYYCLRKGHECFEDYIDSLGIVTRKIYYTSDSELDRQLFLNSENIHLFRYHLPDFLKNCQNSRIFVLNTEQLSEPQRCSHITAIGKLDIGIIDYSLTNIKILAKAGIKNVFYLPFQYNPTEVSKLADYSSKTPNHDVGIINCSSTHRKQVLAALKRNHIDVIDIRGWKEERDRKVGQCKILLNVHYQHDFCVFEHIRCDRWLFAGKTVISEPCNDLENLDIRANVLFTTNLVETIKKSLKDPVQQSIADPIIQERKKYLAAFVKHVNKLSEEL